VHDLTYGRHPDNDGGMDDERPTGFVGRAERWWKRWSRRGMDVLEQLPFGDTAVRLYERDKHAAGTLLGSALAMRLFLFFVPSLLLLLGVAGLLGRYSSADSAADFGVGGPLGEEIDTAFEQDQVTPWVAIGIGLFGMATTGRSLSRALVLSSALSWQMGGRQRLRIRVVGVVVGIFVTLAVTWALVDVIRRGAGVAVVSASFVGVVGVYVVLWSLLYLALPRTTSDPGAVLPGAAVVAVVMAGLQVATQMFLPQQVDGASSLYGVFGGVVAFLGWFFILGRVLAFTFALNAVLFEDVGSLSRFVFGLPLLRAIPRRSAAFARYFDLQ
jgi:uncharacterized BrkB/YihY/UPF0761 family membrane protein